MQAIIDWQKLVRQGRLSTEAIADRLNEAKEKRKLALDDRTLRKA